MRSQIIEIFILTLVLKSMVPPHPEPQAQKRLLDTGANSSAVTSLAMGSFTLPSPQRGEGRVRDNANDVMRFNAFVLAKEVPRPGEKDDH